MRRLAVIGLWISGCVLPAFEIVPSLDGASGSGAGGNGATAGSSQAGKGGNNQGGTKTADAGSAGAGDTPAAGTGGDAPSEPVTGSYAVTGSWPERAVALTQMPGALTYDKIEVHDRFLAESCAIGDYDGDGHPDISSGRHWYEGPAFTEAHIFRGTGHNDLPRAGATEEITLGASDDYADYAFDMDGDGFTDIINIANPDANATVVPVPQAAASAYWYKNPGGGDMIRSDVVWEAHLMHDDVQAEQHGLGDLDGDGKPELYGACRDCVPAKRKGYYQGNWSNPTEKWTFHPVTVEYPFPFGTSGALHGMGFGDVNGDGQPDLLERGGVWLDVLAASPNYIECPLFSCGFIKMPLYDGAADAMHGGSHMFAFDVDGDGDGDIVSTEWAHGYGLSWYEQTAPNQFTKRQFMGTNAAADVNKYGPVVFSQPHAMEVADMDGDGVPDLITGKTRYAHPNGYGDEDIEGLPVIYVFRTRRNTPSAANGGSVTFEPHLVDESLGVGRQIAIGHLNDDGILDMCIASKLGLSVFLGQ